MKVHLEAFAAELAKAGLAGVCSFNTAGALSFPAGTAPEVVAHVESLLQAHDADVAAAAADKVCTWEKIKAERDRLTQGGGYPLDGHWFHSDAYSLSQQQGLILSAMQVQASGGDMDAPLMGTPWYAMGGVPVVMTASLALRLLPAAMAQQVAIFEAAKAHKAALDISDDPASYDYSDGWPKVFGK